MNIELVSIATDTYPLDGLFYTPRDRPAKAAVMFFHGNCHNFYTGPSRFMTERLVLDGYACLAFNRRGHDMVTSIDGRNIGGGAFQMTHEAIADNRYAARWLAGKGFGAPILIGHSNGGVLAAQHCADQSETPALVLLSAHCGGAGIAAKLSQRGLFGRHKLPELIAEAEAMVSEGRGKELLLLPGWWWVISAESLLDYAHNMPATIDNAPKIGAPVLYVRGDQEPPELYPAEAFAAKCAGACDVSIIANCDHFYTDHEVEVSDMAARWLKQTI